MEVLFLLKAFLQWILPAFPLPLSKAVSLSTAQFPKVSAALLVLQGALMSP